jgi:peptidoglycan/xylan/chitin deacetylase (PgdA/CDA1 family)
VALTFDDLPAHSALPPGMSRADVARGILAALEARRVPPSYGFVNAKSLEARPENAEVLRLWRAAGHPLANHTYSHIDLNASSAQAFQADVIANEKTLRDFMGEDGWRWLRFPYLRAGDTAEKRGAVAAFLKQRRYRVAEVTLNFDDWAYNEPYARCAAKQDAAGIEELKRSYETRAAASLSDGQAAAKRVYGRDIAHVMLLHIGAFQTLMLPKLLELLDARGFKVVTLAEAEADPAYAEDPGLPMASGATLLEQMIAVRKLAPVSRDGGPPARLSEICR